MYKYGIKGWKSDLSTNSYGSVKPNFGLAFNGLTSERLDEEDSAEQEEANDVAAPLPSGDERLGRHASIKSHPIPLHSEVSVSGEEGGPKGKLFAKDKRKLREKRRSTGVAKYLSETADQEEELREHHDSETKRNTSINETSVDQDNDSQQITTSCETSAPAVFEHASSPLLKVFPSDRLKDETTDCTSIPHVVSSSTNVESDLVQNRPTCDLDSSVRNTSSSQTIVTDQRGSNSTNGKHNGENHLANEVLSIEEVSTAPQISSDHTVLPSSIKTTASVCSPIRPPKPATKPEPLLKPALAAKRWTSPSPRPTPDTQSTDVTKMQEEKRQLQNRLVILEKLLEEERKENAALKELLMSKDQKISELEYEVEALNEDLDLADEECSKLEDENKVLLRAMSEHATQE